MSLIVFRCPRVYGCEHPGENPSLEEDGGSIYVGGILGGHPEWSGKGGKGK